MNLENKEIILRDGVKINCAYREHGSDVWLVGTHGVGEHLGRHHHLLDVFAQDFNVLVYDLRGHGRSGGQRGLVESVDILVEDLEEVLNFLTNSYSLKRHILFGHSMGGLVTARYLQKHMNSDRYPERVFLSSPAVGVPGLLSKLLHYPSLNLLRLFKTSIPSFSIKGLIDLHNLSHDPLIYDNYLRDEQNILSLNIKTGLSIIEASRSTFLKPLRAKCPLYVAYGTDDHIIDPKAIEYYFQNIEKGANLFPIEGGYHELHNEIEKYQIPFKDYLRKNLLEVLYHDGI